MNTHAQDALRISVIIPHLNQPGGLKRCLAALWEGQRLPDEVIVVDNGSARLPDTICKAFPRVTLLQHAVAGPGLARNHGVAQSTGDVLAFIDADCCAAPQWLAVAERQIRLNGMEILGGDVRIACVDPKNLTPLEAYESIFAYRMDRYIARESFTGTGNLVMRRAVFDHVGPFKGLDVAEDRDWGQRATAAGHVITYVPKLLVFHPARAGFADLQAKWDRQLAHDFANRRGVRGRLAWGGKALLLILSPIIEIPRVALTDRIRGRRNRMRAFAILTRIRLYRALRMAQLGAGLDPDTLLRRWNPSDVQ